MSAQSQEPESVRLARALLAPGSIYTYAAYRDARALADAVLREAGAAVPTVDGEAYAVDAALRHAREVVRLWTYLQDARVGTLGDLVSPAGALVELSNALLHLQSHLAVLDGEPED